MESLYPPVLFDESKYQKVWVDVEQKVRNCFHDLDYEDEGMAMRSDERLSRLCLLLGLNENAVRLMLNKPTKKVVPIWEKTLLTLDEASALFGIGVNRLREMTEDDNCPFVLWIQSKRMIKRKVFEAYLEKAFSI